MLAPYSGDNLQGWAAIENDTRTRFKNNPDPGLGKIDHKDHVIHIEGDRAFVQYKEDVVFPSKVKGEQFVVKYYEVRRMIKVDGQWKIVNMISALLTEEMRPADIMTHLR